MLMLFRMHVHVFISINCTCRVFCYARTEASGRVFGRDLRSSNHILCGLTWWAVQGVRGLCAYERGVHRGLRERALSCLCTVSVLSSRRRTIRTCRSARPG